MRTPGTGCNQETIQESNRSLVISLLRRNGVSSRVQLANYTGLKQATVTNIISHFIRWKLVREVGFLVGIKGRRSIGIAIDGDAYSVIGIRLSRKYYIVGLFDLTGKLKAEKTVDVSERESPRQVIDGIKKTTALIFTENVDTNILAIGVALPGPFMTQNGKIALMTESQEWGELSIKEELEAQFGRPVFLEHDANAAALTQLWHDKEVGDAECVAYIAAGQGIGSGILYKGELLKGENGIAGEIGHTSIDFNGPLCSCGNRGCLEQYCSSIAFVKKLGKTLGCKKLLTVDAVRERISAGDETCIGEYSHVCRMLGYGLSNLVYNFNPGVIVLGDEMAHIAPEIMLRQVTDVVRSRVLPVLFQSLKIKISGAVKISALHGAAIVAVSEVFAHPEIFLERRR